MADIVLFSREERKQIENYEKSQEEKEEFENCNESREESGEIDITFNKKPYFTKKCQPRKLLKTVYEISPVPRPISVVKNNNRLQKAELFTTSPYKRNLKNSRRRNHNKLQENLINCLQSTSLTSCNLPKLKTKKQSTSTSSKQM